MATELNVTLKSGSGKRWDADVTVSNLLWEYKFKCRVFSRYEITDSEFQEAIAEIKYRKSEWEDEEGWVKMSLKTIDAAATIKMIK